MRIDENEHPDQLNDWRNFKNIHIGSKQYLDDMALDAYFAILNNGGTNEQAQQAFKKVYENYK